MRYGVSMSVCLTAVMSNCVRFGRFGKIDKITLGKLFKMQNCFPSDNTIIDFVNNW